MIPSLPTPLNCPPQTYAPKDLTRLSNIPIKGDTTLYIKGRVPFNSLRRTSETDRQLVARAPREFRPSPLCLPLIIILLLALFSTARAADLVPNLDLSISRALDFLASQQNPDGSFASDGPRIALTGLATMSFLSAGHTPDAGKYGLAVHKSLDFLLASLPESAYAGQADNSRMYGQGIVTLTFAEAAGVDPDPIRRQKLNAAVAKMTRLILAAQSIHKDQSSTGGWRYDPTSCDSDLSLSAWNLLALRAARDTGVPVPQDSVDRAANYILNCYHKPTGGFSYQPGGQPSPAMTAVASLTLHLLGKSDRAETLSATKFLLDNPVTMQTRFPYYSLYYSTQAAHQIGDPAWSKIWTTNSSLLISLQQPDGGFPVSPTGEEPGRIYSTSLAVLSLTVPYQLLPAY
jgi:hypothetical protein